MTANPSTGNEAQVYLQPVTGDNWRQIAGLQMTDAQREFVSDACYYLALCCYGNTWQPLAIYLNKRVIGFLMWGIDPADNSCWLGGIQIDKKYQRRGYGRQALQRAIAMLGEEHGFQRFALSYAPDNEAKHLYWSLGFVETNEWEDDEIVARLSLSGEDIDSSQF